MSRKRKISRDRFDEDVLDAMRYVLVAPPVMEDILPKIEAALGETKELVSLKESTPVNERTPEWEADYKKRMRACSKRFNALMKRWEELLHSPGPTTRH